MTHGGLPRGRATLLCGGPGSGKTVFALESLVNGARRWNEPGIFVAFEEDSRRIIANASSFGWDLPALQRKKLFLLDAQPTPELIQSGGFDLLGLLAALEAKVESMGARRIVFDSVDVLLELLADPALERREVFRIHDWLLGHDITAMITSKAQGDGALATDERSLGFLPFMVDCAVALKHNIAEGISQRSLRVIKYRGSAFTEGESPFLIGERGLEVAGASYWMDKEVPASTERISTGVARLDAMLEGGYYRGASVLITGSPGAAKTTLGGAFAAAACGRGEPTLFVSFDSNAAELIRNLASVNIRLARFQRQGLLKVTSARGSRSSAEAHLISIKTMAEKLRARCLIIDPLSALAKPGNVLTAPGVVERLMDWVKAEGMTLLCTSLLQNGQPAAEGTPIEVSTIADTSLHLSHVVNGGERNRTVSVVKSRGTAHSNQVRELVLSRRGVTLADVYTAGGEVLLGTLRWEREREVAAEQQRLRLENHLRLAEFEKEEAELVARLQALERELTAKRAVRDSLRRQEGRRESMLHGQTSGLRNLRRADVE